LGDPKYQISVDWIFSRQTFSLFRSAQRMRIQHFSHAPKQAEQYSSCKKKEKKLIERKIAKSIYNLLFVIWF
jgi:hypothetical protein